MLTIYSKSQQENYWKKSTYIHIHNTRTSKCTLCIEFLSTYWQLKFLMWRTCDSVCIRVDLILTCRWLWFLQILLPLTTIIVMLVVKNVMNWKTGILIVNITVFIVTFCISCSNYLQYFHTILLLFGISHSHFDIYFYVFACMFTTA